MNIVVIGASNSIIGENGYVAALRERHHVRNLSAGDVPVFYTLSKILLHQAEISQADVVILDHTISDRLSYYPALRDTYMHNIREIYRILMSINPNVVCLVFPLCLEAKLHDAYLAELEEICADLGVILFNLQPLKSVPKIFEDPAHIHCELSFLIGRSLAAFLSDRRLRKNGASGPMRHPFTLQEARALMPGRAPKRFQSRLAQAEYHVIDAETVIDFETDHQAVYMEYVVLREDPRWIAMDVNGAAHYYGGLDITGDIVSDAVSSRFVLSPVHGEAELKLPYARGQAVTSHYAPMNLVRLMFRNCTQELILPSLPSYEAQDLDLRPIWNAIEQLENVGWFAKARPLSEQSARIVEDHNKKGIANHKRHFADTVEKGNAVRRTRMDLFVKALSHGTVALD